MEVGHPVCKHWEIVDKKYWSYAMIHDWLAYSSKGGDIIWLTREL